MPPVSPELAFQAHQVQLPILECRPSSASPVESLFEASSEATVVRTAPQCFTIKDCIRIFKDGDDNSQLGMPLQGYIGL